MGYFIGAESDPACMIFARPAANLARATQIPCVFGMLYSTCTPGLLHCKPHSLCGVRAAGRSLLENI